MQNVNSSNLPDWLNLIHYGKTKEQTFPAFFLRIVVVPILCASASVLVPLLYGKLGLIPVARRKFSPTLGYDDTVIHVMRKMFIPAVVMLP